MISCEDKTMEEISDVFKTFWGSNSVPRPGDNDNDSGSSDVAQGFEKWKDNTLNFESFLLYM